MSESEFEAILAQFWTTHDPNDWGIETTIQRVPGASVLMARAVITLKGQARVTAYSDPEQGLATERLEQEAIKRAIKRIMPGG